MNSGQGIVLAVAALAIAAILWGISRKRRSQKHRQPADPERERETPSQSDAGKDEDVLAFGHRRRRPFEFRPLVAADRADFLYRWNEVQSRFVDDPKDAIVAAGNVVTELMRARGYTSEDSVQRMAAISANYLVAAGKYRAAREIMLRHERGQANTTEELRQAMLYYRALFQQLLGQVPTQKRSA